MILFVRFYNIHFHNVYKALSRIIPAEHRITASASIEAPRITIDSIANLGRHRVKVIISPDNQITFTVMIKAKTITYQKGDDGYDFLLTKFEELSCKIIKYQT